MNTESTTTTAKKITVIPATKSLHPERDGVTPSHKKRVAAYCRVSTSLEEQQGSFKLQKQYYESLINHNPEWEPAGVYGDEGKSGTSLRGRTGFLEMMDDVRAGKIDYIITKATSRFGRNNSEFIEVLDELESYGVEVLFESEGILTSALRDRTMLQVMGATNEHYSSTLSNNIRWSNERNMRKGKVTFCYKRFLGYEKGEDGKPRIVEEEAKIVRMIFEKFLKGESYTCIAKYLIREHIRTPSGEGKWTGGEVKNILTNEKYTGDALLQKTFKRNYLDKRAHKNNGEKPMVLVENNHPAIISKDAFERARVLVEKRSRCSNPGTADSPFVGKIVCADCGSYFGHKTWKSRGNISYTMWVCNHKYAEENTYGGNKCKTANLREEWVQAGYLYTINQILARKSDYLGKYERKLIRIDKRLGSSGIKTELRTAEKDAKKIQEELENMKTEWEFTFGSHDAFDEKKMDLERRAKENVKTVNSLEAEEKQLHTEKSQIETFINTIQPIQGKLTRFNNKNFLDTVDHIEVNQFILAYYFYGGECIKVNIELVKKMCR